MSPVEYSHSNKLRFQIRRLSLLIVGLSGLTSLLLWQSIDDTVTARKTLLKDHATLDSIYALESLLHSYFTESRSGPATLARQDVQKKLEALQTETADMRHLAASVKAFSDEWKTGSGNALFARLRTFRSELADKIKSDTVEVEQASNRASQFLLLNLLLLAGALSIFNRFMTQRVFNPLSRLQEKMFHFKAGYFDQLPVSSTDTEIGQLQMQFNEMAERVSLTVKELQELDRLKSEFLAMASHELRTPMTSIKGSIGLILQGLTGAVNADTQSMLTIAETETERLIRLINDILDLTKIEAKKFTLQKQKLSIHAIANTCHEALRGLAEKMQVQVALVQDLEDWHVFADPDRLQQVITNLLSNAIKFSPKGSVVQMGWGLDEKKMFQFYVQDQGPGIKDEEQEMIFETFKQSATGQSQRELKGTGLGLPISKALVEQHGGTIGLYSSLGAGSTFYFTLPDAQRTTGSFQSLEAVA